MSGDGIVLGSCRERVEVYAKVQEVTPPAHDLNTMRQILPCTIPNVFKLVVTGDAALEIGGTYRGVQSSFPWVLTQLLLESAPAVHPSSHRANSSLVVVEALLIDLRQQPASHSLAYAGPRPKPLSPSSNNGIRTHGPETS
jgi:hypothetical protein